MVAHSLKDPVFGPAQKLHGATYVVDAEFGAAQLSKANIVLDIGWAGRVLEEVLGELKVTLTESPSAWASYEAPVRKDS